MKPRRRRNRATRKPARLREFYRRLARAEPAGSIEAALELLEEVLRETEDELTDIPYDPNRWQTDGRLYAPQWDSVRDVPGNPTVKRFRSRGHNTFISENGAIEIRTVAGDLEFQKVGADGRDISGNQVSMSGDRNSK